MRKEVLLAILIGATIGGLVAFGVWRANLSLNKAVSPSSGPQPATNNSTNSTPDGLSVTEPEDGTISSSEKFTIKGSAKQGSTIAILAAVENIIVEAKADGTFEAEVKLEGGVNEIKVTAFDPDGKESTTTLTVVYSTEFES